jgi:hypothetical protein
MCLRNHHAYLLHIQVLMWMRPDQHAEVRDAWPPLGDAMPVSKGKKRGAEPEKEKKEVRKTEEQALLSSEDELSSS